jgi:hypothetical protein
MGTAAAAERGVAQLPQPQTGAKNGIAGAPGWAHTEAPITAVAALPDMPLLVAVAHA